MNIRGGYAFFLSATGVVLTASCGYAAAIHAAEITQERLIGTWTSPAGTSLTFSRERTFAGSGFGEVEAMADCARPEALSTGRWAFYARPEGGDVSVPHETATRGHDLQLSFDGDATCTVWVYLYGDAEDPAMCPTRDPDDGCPSGGYLKREEAASGS
ncbi:hypothetical protein [Streptomyces fradiae]|uniref:hypothetical protein n=1 Tax=Streptomyces fradiae TaxID=1906 RepID=UPI00364660F6